MPALTTSHVALALLTAFAIACGSSADGGNSPTAGADAKGNPSPPPSSSTPPSSEPPPSEPTPTPAVPYPAFTPEIAQLANHGGAVLKNPVFVTISWPNEPNADTFEKLGDAIGGSAYWSTIVSEYGVGAASSGPSNHVRMTTSVPASLDDTSLTQLITTNVTNGTWPAETEGMLYVMYLPVGTKLDLGGGEGDACDAGVGGFHDDLTVAGKDVAYAVVIQCTGLGLDDATLTASHEMAEAAVDPFPETQGAWYGVDDAHFAWDLMQRGQDENGDLCEMYDDALVRSPSADVPWALQRQWSNKSAAAGHAPCVPAVPGAYFNVTPLDVKDDLAFDLTAEQGPANQAAKGFAIAMGASRDISIGFYSDAPTEAWNLSAVELDPFADTQDPFAAASDKQLELSLDKTSGKNGDKATLTVKVQKTLTTKSRVVLLMSTQKGQTHYMPLLVGGT